MRISPNGLDLRKVCVKFSVKVIGLCFGLTDDMVRLGRLGIGLDKIGLGKIG